MKINNSRVTKYKNYAFISFLDDDTIWTSQITHTGWANGGADKDFQRGADILLPSGPKPFQRRTTSMLAQRWELVGQTSKRSPNDVATSFESKSAINSILPFSIMPWRRADIWPIMPGYYTAVLTLLTSCYVIGSEIIHRYT